MFSLFIIIFLASLIFSIIGLIKPSILKIPTRKLSLKIFSVSILLSFIGMGIFAPETSNTISNQNKGEETEKLEQDTIAEEIVLDSDLTEENSDINSNDSVQQNSQSSNTTQTTSKPTTTSYYSVTQVVDGDTIKISMNGKEETLRLIGLDTPETVDPRKPVQCFGKEASDKAKELLSGKKVKIETDSTQGDRDKYGRLLAYVYREDGLFYNKHMIEKGYAHEYTYGTPYKYQSEFKTAQKNAQSSQLGLWSPNTCDGDTTSSATPTQTTTTTQTTSSTQTQSSGLYYTSSYYTSKYYYPESCIEWKELSPTYLKSYSSLDALLAVYPAKTKSPQCN
jgi:endonuclease YncB( thermonuclease family)